MIEAIRKEAIRKDTCLSGSAIIHPVVLYIQATPRTRNSVSPLSMFAFVTSVISGKTFYLTNEQRYRFAWNKEISQVIADTSLSQNRE